MLLEDGKTSPLMDSALCWGGCKEQDIKGQKPRLLIESKGFVLAMKKMDGSVASFRKLENQEGIAAIMSTAQAKKE